MELGVLFMSKYVFEMEKNIISCGNNFFHSHYDVFEEKKESFV